MDYLCLSIETRKAVGQEYSAVGGMFRQYPLVIVAADERDLVGVRARVRGEHVFRYQVQSPPAGVRAVFDRYMQFTNDLALHPRWYNAVTESCGVGILRIVRGSLIPFIPSMDQLLNGRWDRDAYREGRLGAPGESFEQVRARSEITEEARKAPMTPWFSPAIRVQEVPLRLRARWRSNEIMSSTAQGSNAAPATTRRAWITTSRWAAPACGYRPSAWVR